MAYEKVFYDILLVYLRRFIIRIGVLIRLLKITFEIKESKIMDWKVNNRIIETINTTRGTKYCLVF